MKIIKMDSLRIKNFKGVKDFTFNPNCQSASVYGKNASGKTTIQDAFFYLLFGKDSSGKADFQLKPVSDDGQEIHHLDTEVESILYVGDERLVLMKLYKEKWTKKRGSATKQMEGHTTEHFVDGVPISAGKYNARIGELIDVTAFKLVTSPYCFSSLNWSARRDLLLNICGNVEDSDVITSDPELKPLSTILSDCTINDHRLKVKSQQKKINEKLKEIPARIAENQEMLNDAQLPDQEAKRLLDEKLAGLHDSLARERNNETVSIKRVELNEVIAEILKERSRVSKLNIDGKQPIIDEIDELEREKRKNSNRVESLKDCLERDTKRNVVANEAIARIRDGWYEESKKQPVKDSVCPTCGQELPQEKVEEAKRAFNEEKALRLGRINEEGKQLKEGIDARDNEILEVETEIELLSTKILAFCSDLEPKRKLLETCHEAADTEALDKKKASLEDEIVVLKSGSGVREREISTSIEAAQKELESFSKDQAEYDAAEKARARVSDLEKQEKELAAEYETLEKELFLTETFIRRKVELLEGSINSRFKLARFKLFEEQINGGLKETCEILYNGVPFDRGLNNAARANVGIDIINTLSGYFNLSAPIFCDNAESVNVLESTESQVISLYVSNDAELTVSKTEI